MKKLQMNRQRFSAFYTSSMFLAASHLSVYTEREKVMWCYTISQSEQSSGIFNLWNITVVDKNQETESLGQNFYFDDTFHFNSSKTESVCGSVVEHCISSAKVVGLIPREHMYWLKNVLPECTKSLWIKASAKCINLKITTQSLNQHLSEWQNKQLHCKKKLQFFTVNIIW